MNAGRSTLPVAIIGGGPVGLAAAARLVTRGLPVKLYEAGATVAAHVRDWGHVRLFSPWAFNTDVAATEILREHGWQAPPATTLPTGGDLYSAYLQPLAEAPPLKSVIETGARVRSVSRAGIDKVVSRGRGDHPFALSIETADGASRIELARAVIDASGTWASPNPAAASGTPAQGEVTFADRIAYGPGRAWPRQGDVCRAARARHWRRAFCRKCLARSGAPRRNGCTNENPLGGSRWQSGARVWRRCS